MNLVEIEEVSVNLLKLLTCYTNIFDTVSLILGGCFIILLNSDLVEPFDLPVILLHMLFRAVLPPEEEHIYLSLYFRLFMSLFLAGNSAHYE